MDAMALLCNLQADGPATLRRLHGIGCRTLNDLERADADELAEALAGDPAFARRFVREARALAERFGDAELEPEPAPASPIPVPPQAPRTPAAPTTPVPARVDTARLAAELAERVRRPQGLVLRAGLVDGLDEAWCVALVGQGIRTLEGLRDAPGLALARSLGRPLTELVGLQCLARRRLDEESRSAALLEREDEPEVVIVPARRPLAEPDDVIFPHARRDDARHVGAPATSSTGGRAGSGGPFA